MPINCTNSGTFMTYNDKLSCEVKALYSESLMFFCSPPNSLFWSSVSWTVSNWFIMKCGFCDSHIIPSAKAYGALLAYLSNLKGKGKLDFLHHLFCFCLCVCPFHLSNHLTGLRITCYERGNNGGHLNCWYVKSTALRKNNMEEARTFVAGTTCAIPTSGP